MTHSSSRVAARETWRDWRIEARELIELAHAQPGARVLEIGCGGGGLLQLLSEWGGGVVGADRQESTLELTRRKFDALALAPADRPSLVCLDAGRVLPFGDGAFDAIIGQHVVEHLPDVDAALRECARVLRRGGRLALATPNARYPDPAHFDDRDHVHIFTPGELCAAVERAGLDVISRSTLFPFLSRLRLLRGLGVVASPAFRHAPYFASRGRTIMIAAGKP